MINVTKLYSGLSSGSDSLRYGSHSSGSHTAASAKARKPIVVWTMSRRCNLHCVHCYTDSENRSYPNELNLEEAFRMLEDLSQFQIPALLLSGGEPLYHPHFFKIAQYARQLGLKLTISTNGTLIDSSTARKIKETGFSYVGISFDGVGRINDVFRGKQGAFEEALCGVRHLKAVQQRVGLRFTLTRRNFEALESIFQLVEQEGIDRVCFYHLVYSGRGSRLAKDDLSHDETRLAIDRICDWAAKLKEQAMPVEVLTVDNHVDGVYLYLKLLQTDSVRAEAARRLIEWNGGGAYSSGVGIANIDSVGNVHPDQFWQVETLDNIRKRPFSEIWTDVTQPLLTALRNRLPLLKGRCGACQWQRMCGGSFRVRALQTTGDVWAADPACYLSDEEIAVVPEKWSYNQNRWD
ncbi:MAG: radical SAM protein [Candidatus Omnitrophica bacterium]|nr:radical SAM protein [Candidatus Omnitrophota bacterium]